MASDDNCECPLCMEPFEVDDMSFYPCTCGYQICRFCWHRLKIDGNGLCPACRKAYSENPAHFEPLSEDEIVRIKKERRFKEVQKKQKLTENRRHLSDVRVVQKNLVFVVGLSHRLADAEILRKTEYFGKFGKITKVVINSSPSYAGAQTPSASAYVTYSKADEALKAIQTVNNVQIDNRVLKASLGTTKYCSHFLKGIQCPKVDCMYLHDLGEDNASFTKEQMSQGKHLEYESKLIENVLHIPRNLQNISNDQSNQIIINQIHQGLPSAMLSHSSNQNNQPQTSSSSSTQQQNTNNSNSTNTNSINNFDKNDYKSRVKKSSKSYYKTSNTTDTLPMKNISNKMHDTNKSSHEFESNAKHHIEDEEDETEVSEEVVSEEEAVAFRDTSSKKEKSTKNSDPSRNSKTYLSALNTDESKSQTEETPPKSQINYKDIVEKNIIANEEESIVQNELNNQENTIKNNDKECNNEREPDTADSISAQHIVQEEDLGFDPWDEATKSLQDLMKIESNSHLVTKPALDKSSAENQATSSNITKPTTNCSQNYSSTNGEVSSSGVSRQYLPQNSQSSMFKTDLQSLYKLHSNGINGTHDLNQLYQNQINQNNISVAKDGIKLMNDTNTQNKLNEMLLATNPANPAFNSNHENYLNKLLLQKQNLTKQSIAAPPGFNNSNIVFNSPISTSSTSSSSSSTSSSVNNSTSTTPALNSNLANNPKSNPNAFLLNDFTNEYNSQDGSKLENASKQANPPLFSNSLQDTFRSIFPNANISFGGVKNSTNTNNSSKLSNNFDSKLSNYSNPTNKSNNQFTSSSFEKNSQKNCWPDDPAIVSLNNGLNGHGKDINGQLSDLHERVQTDYDNIYNNNPNKQLEQLSYLTSSLSLQQQQQQPNNINNLASLLKKQQQNDQFNNSLINQFQLLYQQHQLAQLQNSSFLNNGNNSNNSNNISNNMNHHMINNNNQMGKNSLDQLGNKNLEDLHNHHQKYLLMNSNFNNLNGNNNLLNNFLNNDLSQFNNTSNMNNYGYVMDSNQNIQSKNLHAGFKSQNQNNTSAGITGMPPLLNLQQQNYMQQFLLQNFNTNPATAATTNSNSD